MKDLFKKYCHYVLGLLLAVPLLALSQSANWYSSAIPAASYSATRNSSDITNPNYRGVHAVINMTAYVAGTTWTPHIQGKDLVSGNYYDILVGAAISTTPSALVVLRVYPGITAAANLSAADFVPQTWRVTMVQAGGSGAATFSVSFFSQP